MRVHIKDLPVNFVYILHFLNNLFFLLENRLHFDVVPSKLHPLVFPHPSSFLNNLIFLWDKPLSSPHGCRSKTYIYLLILSIFLFFKIIYFFFLSTRFFLFFKRKKVEWDRRDLNSSPGLPKPEGWAKLPYGPIYLPFFISLLARKKKIANNPNPKTKNIPVH